jgi:glutamyl-tRNA synthetase
MEVRVRFAPSPTGGLHLGGVRTVLYNYLFAKQNNGKFILRIEDTDQARFVEGAEQYILDCLHWCGLEPDESIEVGGPYAPYRQSDRKEIYRDYALRLVAAGRAYYAFDTPEEIENMRHTLKTSENTNPQYDHSTRKQMRNSLTMSQKETEALIAAGTPYVIRILMPGHHTVAFTDMIRGEISFDCQFVDDKVLLKADGMPTYHLAVVVDDYLMKITHAFRGEEWLPSAPVHLLLWEYFGWQHAMPQWAHLPLILKPDGNGKLSKRDGERLGFPVFAMNWHDARTNVTSAGFKEIGFLPQAFVNMLALLGWNDGSGQEIFTLDDLAAKFSIERVHKGGAKFDYEKAKWFNHHYIQHSADEVLLPYVMPYFVAKGITPSETALLIIIGLVKERCTLLSDFYPQGYYFFQTPQYAEIKSVADKWNPKIEAFFVALAASLQETKNWITLEIENTFNFLLQTHSLKKGDVLLPFRVILVGAKYGPGVFVIAELIGKQETVFRINHVMELLRAPAASE